MGLLRTCRQQAIHRRQRLVHPLKQALGVAVHLRVRQVVVRRLLLVPEQLGAERDGGQEAVGGPSPSPRWARIILG